MENYDEFEIKIVKKKTKKSRNVLSELKKDLKLMIEKDNRILDDIKIYKDITGYNVDKLNKEQLCELLMFCTNNQITRDREVQTKWQGKQK